MLVRGSIVLGFIGFQNEEQKHLQKLYDKFLDISDEEPVSSDSDMDPDCALTSYEKSESAEVGPCKRRKETPGKSFC